MHEQVQHLRRQKKKSGFLKDLCLQCLKSLMQLWDIWRGNNLEPKGTYTAFQQHMALLTSLLEDCFLLSCQHFRRDITKVNEVLKTATRIIRRMDNLLINSFPFSYSFRFPFPTQMRKKMQLLEAEVKQIQARNRSDYQLV